MIKPKSIINDLFGDEYQLIDGTDEIFELDLASWEHNSLSQKALIERGAYFKIINGKETTHYRACNLQNLEDIHKNSSFRTKIFFLNGKYSTGYATHSLFPYRGKFHPQFIRALLNILKIKKGDVVLDPMSGSATLSVESNLLGIDSVAVDLSPFCCLMGRVKTFSLNLDPEILKSITRDPKQIATKLSKQKVPKYFLDESNNGKRSYYEIVLLAFLDAMGFACRSNSSLQTLFPRVLERYIATIINFQEVRKKLNLQIGKSKILQGSTLSLPLNDDSIDAIITSPPYSFAIDYLKNDQPQLEYLGYDLDKLREEMIGLQGRGVDNKLEIYFEQMQKAMQEMSRVSKKGTPIVIIIGTNEIQTNGVRLETKIKEVAEKQNLKFDFEILKPIRGLQNTMKDEYVLFFTNNK